VETLRTCPGCKQTNHYTKNRSSKPDTNVSHPSRSFLYLLASWLMNSPESSGWTTHVSDPPTQCICGTIMRSVQNAANVGGLHNIYTKSIPLRSNMIPEACCLLGTSFDGLGFGTDRHDLWPIACRESRWEFNFTTFTVKLIPETVFVLVALDRIPMKLLANCLHVKCRCSHALAIFSIPHTDHSRFHGRTKALRLRMGLAKFRSNWPVWE